MLNPARLVTVVLRFSVTRPWIIVVAIVVLTTVFACFIPRVQLRLDARSMVPIGHADLQASDDAARLFGLRDVVAIGVANQQAGIYNPETLAQIARLSKDLTNIEGVVPSSVSSITTAPGLVLRNGKLDLRPLLPNSRIDIAEATRLRRDIESMGLNDGVLAARDGRAALILAEIEPDADRYLMLRRIKELTRDDRSILLSGTALAESVLGVASAQDLLRLIPISLLVLAIMLFIGFRHLVPAIISLMEIGVSLIWTAGLMGLCGQSVFVTTLVMPVILISVGVSDDVYVLKHYFKSEEQPNDPDQLIRIFRPMIWPVGLTAISTIVGLLSLAAFNLEPFRVFGIFGAVAILSSTLLTFTLVPTLLVLLKPRLPRSANSSGHKPRNLGSFIFDGLRTARPGRILVLAVLSTAGAVALATRVRIDDSWIKNLPASSEVSKGDRAINELLAGTTTLDFMIDSGQANGFLDPKFLLKLMSFEDRLAALPSTGAIYGLHDDILRLHASLRGMDYAPYRASVLQGETQLKPSEIEQTLILLSVARRAADWNWIDKDRRRARLTVFIRSANYDRIDRMLQTVLATENREQPDGVEVTPFGDGWISYATVRLLVRGQTISIALAMMTDLVLLTVLFRSLRLSLIAIIPVAVSVLFVFSFLAATGIPLGIANSMFAGIAIGIGLDFAIHLTAAFRSRRSSGLREVEAMRQALIHTAPAIVTSAAAIAAGFSVLALSQILPNVQLALMICLSLTVCAVATLVLVPCLALFLRSGRQS